MLIDHRDRSWNRYTHPSQRSGFWNSELGHRFRATAFRLQGLQLPTEIPRTVTLLGPVSGEDVRPAPLSCNCPLTSCLTRAQEPSAASSCSTSSRTAECRPSCALHAAGCQSAGACGVLARCGCIHGLARQAIHSDSRSVTTYPCKSHPCHLVFAHRAQVVLLLHCAVPSVLCFVLCSCTFCIIPGCDGSNWRPDFAARALTDKCNIPPAR